MKKGIKYLVTGCVLAGILGWFGMIYFRQLEKTEALAMQSILINVAIVQDKYAVAHQHYADQWAAILPQVALPNGLKTTVTPVPQDPAQYLFSFGDNPNKGYRVSLQVNPKEKQGFVVALREGSWWYHYELRRNFAQDKTECLGSKMNKRFCHYFLQFTQPLEFENLISAPAPSDKKE